MRCAREELIKFQLLLRNFILYQLKAHGTILAIDFIGPIHPTSSQGNRYILTVSDYFSKWAEAIPFPSKHAFVTANALFKVCIFSFFTSYK